MPGQELEMRSGDRRCALAAGLPASHVEVVCARMLSLAGLVVFSFVPLWALNEHQLIVKDANMWLKVLGLLCAGVFVGAALVEAKQMIRRKRNRDEGGADDQADEVPRDADDAEVAVSR